jgi:hypothetical protein
VMDDIELLVFVSRIRLQQCVFEPPHLFENTDCVGFKAAFDLALESTVARSVKSVERSPDIYAVCYGECADLGGVLTNLLICMTTQLGNAVPVLPVMRCSGTSTGSQRRRRRMC